MKGVKVMFQNDKGFTLLEIVVCIAIILVIGVSLIPLFSFGYTQTVASGNKTTALYKEAESMDSALDKISTGFTTSTSKTLVLTFGGTVFSVTGTLYKAAVDYVAPGEKATIFSFQPN